MKKVIIKQFEHAEVADPRTTFGFLKIPGDMIRAEGEKMEVSDGYHTFDELYEHRIILFITLCHNIQYCQLLELASNPFTPVKKVWRSKKHSDGSEWDGWFILGIGEKKGEQVTYHLPNIKWDDVSFASTLEQAPEWDGHTSMDVLDRLKNV